jgi:hypothetical protein
MGKRTCTETLDKPDSLTVFIAIDEMHCVDRNDRVVAKVELLVQRTEMTGESLASVG